LVVVVADVDPATVAVVAPAAVATVAIVGPVTVPAVTDPVTFDVAFPAGAADCPDAVTDAVADVVGPEFVFGTEIVSGPEMVFGPG
jgi:hypothetical protein